MKFILVAADAHYHNAPRLPSHEDLTDRTNTCGPDQQQGTDTKEADRLSDLQPRTSVGDVQKERDRHDCGSP